MIIFCQAASINIFIKSIKSIFKYSISKTNDYEERISNLENDLKRMTNERKEAFEVKNIKYKCCTYIFNLEKYMVINNALFPNRN